MLFFCTSIFAQYKIIPEPFSIEYTDVKFPLTKKININTKSTVLDFETQYLKQLLEKKGYEIVLNDKQKSKSIEVNINIESDTTQSSEAYKIKCNNAIIDLVAYKNNGVYNGVQTIDQLFPNYSENEKLTNCLINDYPKYGWRGLMLDVSRHFFTVDEVKSYIDLMSRYKFNVFHWHLTDDEGWRVEIKSLPKLTEIGAWRAERTGKFRTREAPNASEPKTYGGFYTQEQIKEVVAYAQQRHITIVPEIDVPGHSMALLAAYPELSTKKEPKLVSCGFKFSEWYGEGKFKMLVENTLNPSDEKVYEVLDKIYGEVATLFPSEYIHVGGDEAYHGYWEADKNCKEFMDCYNLKNSLELQSYFMKRVEKIVSSKGKKMIGWDEILYGGLADGAAVMSWQGMKGGIEAAKAGHKVVMSPTQFCYLDYTQGDKSIEEPIYADLSLKKAYEFNPLPDGVDAKLILGGQGNLWTEQIPNLSHAFYMTYPRALALSESLWSPNEKKNWETFSKKIEYHFSVFDQEEIEICKAVYDPIIKIYKEGDKMMCVLSCETNDVAIYYTLNSTFPNKKSIKYTVPFEIPNTKITLNTTTFRDGKQLGRLIHLPKAELDKRVK
jgi:hexosaminidase